MNKEEILKDEALAAALREHFRQELKVQDLEEELAKYRAAEEAQKRRDTVYKLAKEYDLAEDLLSDEFVQFCVDFKAESEEAWTESVKKLLADRKGVLSKVAQAAQSVGTGNSAPEVSEALQPLFPKPKEGDGEKKVSDEDLLAKFKGE